MSEIRKKQLVCFYYLKVDSAFFLGTKCLYIYFLQPETLFFIVHNYSRVQFQVIFIIQQLQITQFIKKGVRGQKYLQILSVSNKILSNKSIQCKMQYLSVN